MSIRERRHIAINALHIAWGVNAGTETYLSNIISPWYESAPPGAEFTLFCQAAPAWWRGDREYFRVRVISNARSLWRRILLEQCILPLFYYSKYDLVFHPGYVGSWLARVPQVVTIHDAFAWVCPKEVGKAKEVYWKTLIPASARKADLIIADTFATANDIARFCHVRPEKICVVHLAGGHLGDLVPDSAIFQKLRISAGDYFHSVGVFKEIKNPWRILRAYRRYRTECVSSPPKKLVMVGHVGGKRALLIENSARAEPGVILAGRISDNELAALYRHSAGLVFPSLYEGFGLPVLEAQRLGCPVITSNVSCMPEVAGNGAVLVDPMKEEEISSALVSWHHAKPNDLIGRGVANADKFSWTLASESTLTLLMDVLRRRESVR
jgi:glycosyltransferase involved in cell wall biosynthesis